MFPRLIQIGSFSLPTYGVLVALAFLVALAMASRFAKQRGINSEKIVNLGVYCALAGMLGAKILMIALDPEYRDAPRRSLFPRDIAKRRDILWRIYTGRCFCGFLYARAESTRPCDVDCLRQGLRSDMG